jgi:hypothetical protein
LKSYLSLQGTPRRAVQWCVVLTMVYITLIFLTPARPGVLQSHTLEEYHMGYLLYALPSIIVWFAAFIGYAKMHKFSLAVKNTEQGQLFYRLSKGLTWLAWSLPLIAISNRLFTGLGTSHSGFSTAAVIISNYIAVALNLISFLIIGSASKAIPAKNRHSRATWHKKALIGVLIVLGILYSYLILKSLNFSSILSSDNMYKLPVWLTIMTIIIPFIYAWFVGFLALYDLLLYAKYVPGLLYKEPLQQIVLGLLFVIVSFIVSQYLITVWNLPALMVLDTKLAVIIVLRLLEGVGFVMIAFGAYRLRRIEQI